MKLSECQMGRLVSVKPDELEIDELRIGHVVGLARQATTSSETLTVIPMVMFAGNVEPTAIHHDKLDLFTSY